MGGASLTDAEPRRLNLGCGRLPLEGYVNVDFLGGEVTAEATRLPFRDDAFDEVLASHVLEHIPDLTAAMREIHRVLCPDGTLEIVVPYGLRGLYGAHHLHAFDLNTTLQAFCKEKEEGYTSLQFVSLFRMVRREIRSYRLPFLNHVHRFLGWVPGLVERHPQGRLISRLPLGPRREAAFVLRTVKNGEGEL